VQHESSLNVNRRRSAKIYKKNINAQNSRKLVLFKDPGDEFSKPNFKPVAWIAIRKNVLCNLERLLLFSNYICVF
jgi:hypothetical protein